MVRMSLDDKLGLDKFYTDEQHSHILLNENFSDEGEIQKLVKACPAGLYRYEDGCVIFSHEGCLECGTCRVLSGGKVIKEWNYPAGEMGVEYKKS